MNPELIVAAMLNTTAINALVGNRRAMAQLPQNSAFPAIVYTIVDSSAQPNLNYSGGRQMARARIQINPIAKSIGDVKTILDAVRAAMDFKLQQVYATKTVISSRLELLGPIEKDDDLGVWTQPVDYMLMWYE
jgi:hypothetical protein